MFNRKPYSSDLSTPQWNKIRRLLPRSKPGGRPRSVDLREVFNAILYRLENGCTQRASTSLRPEGLGLRINGKTYPMTFLRRVQCTSTIMLGLGMEHGRGFTT
jgi:hypothetical protein